MTVTIDAPARQLPIRLNVGVEHHTQIDGEDVVMIGASPGGLPVIMTPAQWETLKASMLTRLTYSDHVRAGGGRYHITAARFLTGTSHDTNKYIRYRNGNGLDIRPSNIMVLPRHQLKSETREQKEIHPHDRKGYNLLR